MPDSTFNGILGEATVDFGVSGDIASVLVAEPYVGERTRVLLTFAGSTADHDLEDSMIEQLHLAVDVQEGVGFVIWAHAPSGTWGRYNVYYHCTLYRTGGV